MSRLVLLGVARGPGVPRPRCQPAQVILVGDAAYVVDCGEGVIRQLAAAGVPLTSIREIFLTHHHSDHNADYGNLLSHGLGGRADVSRRASADRKDDGALS